MESPELTTNRRTARDAVDRTGGSSRRRWLSTTLGLAVAGVCGGGAYAHLSSRLEVTRTRLSIGLPRGQGVRVAAVSDLHLCGTADDYSPLVDAIRAENPDLFVVVGDSVDRPASLALLSVLSAVDAPLGKFATLGNWEYLTLTEFGELEDLYHQAGIRLLVNETVSPSSLGGSLRLVGLDDWVGGAPRPELVAQAADQGPTLALAHCPVTFDGVVRALRSVAGRRVAVLSGHTHGGQIAPFGLVPYTPRGSGRYLSGWYQVESAHLYVLRGIGYSYVRVRIGPRPELLVLELR